jgi:hypothetical protein
VIVVNLDDRAQNIFVRPQTTMSDGIGGELRDGYADVIGPSIEQWWLGSGDPALSGPLQELSHPREE